MRRSRTTRDRAGGGAPDYDVRTTSQGFANLASVLAGFAFAAVLLVVQTRPAIRTGDVQVLDEVSALFLLAFTGFIAAALVFSEVTGEKDLVPRCFTVTFLAASSLGISVVCLFCGLVLLTRLALLPDAHSLTVWMFISIVVAATAFLAMGGLDAVMAFDPPRTSNHTGRWVGPAAMLVVAYMPIGIALILRTWVASAVSPVVHSHFDLVIKAALILILLAVGWGEFATGARPEYRLSLPLVTVCMFLQSCVNAALLLLP